ncbi:MAG: hypothetical protein JWO38_7663 [Gemmataceae bacterium]|nr:hypothetical protein [Gemmataceae bacterium]
MRRTLYGLLCGLPLVAAGCGSGSTKTGQELIDTQTQAQEKVDAEERQFQKDQKKK